MEMDSVLTQKEACKLLKIGNTKLYYLRRDGELPPEAEFHIGTRLLFRRDVLEKWIKDQSKKTAQRLYRT